LETSTIRILVVDDYEPWRRFVCSMLQNVTEVHVIGEVSDGLAAVQRAQELQPDLILLDIGLPTLNGIKAARRIRKVSASSKILFMSEDRHPDTQNEALRSGGSGYVVKSNAARDLLPAIHAVLHGERFLSGGLKDSNLADTADAGRDKVAAASPLQSECHELRLCPDDEAFVYHFSHSTKVALDNGYASIVIATESHRAHLLQKLRADGVDVDIAVERGLLTLLDVADSLSTFMGNTATDEDRSAGMPRVIVEAVRTAKEHHLHIAVG
jgi:DNA-binding NarL/FixJ family response regulator